ncbi:MAG: hypothetical protein KKB21_01500 [Nanoarchaeota archaeon]|nr:hypothetical protein [Nanoarchaeota archaeon]MBU4086231.1 hypothetical protein [Nanoarchaeota archaeon]
MKRGVVLGVLVLFVVLVLLSVNLASASWYSDLWGKITGKVVTEEIGCGFYSYMTPVN